MKPVTSYTRALTAEQAEAFDRILREKGFRAREVPYAAFAWSKPDVNATYYQSGKLVIQGKGTRDLVEFVLEPDVLKRAEMGYEIELDPEILTPRIGVDESGKGDFFGPLCVAGVYLNAAAARALLEAGVQDSKRISSAKRIADLAETIRETPGAVCEVVKMGNPAYNRLYQKIGNLNELLAWGHARVIANLMEGPNRMEPAPVRAISDQFARSKAPVERALKKLGQDIALVQRHKAESDLAVAAASIVARHEFLQGLEALEKAFDMSFPKGASGKVAEAARAFVQTHGGDRLDEVAKTHFKTAADALENRLL